MDSPLLKSWQNMIEPFIDQEPVSKSQPIDPAPSRLDILRSHQTDQPMVFEVDADALIAELAKEGE